ncbi:MAG: beta-lactamase family protein [Saprospiraceae bacterium]|nr:beta-lactamase family protein [Saprospiraceae bacterium]
MKRSLLFIVSWVLLVDLSGQSFDSSVEQADQMLRSALDSLHLPGISVSIYANGRIWSKGFGYSDLESKAPVIAGFSRFRIGSISKTLTAAALAKLYEEGNLDPEAELDSYYPDFPEKDYPITIKQIAGHLAGIRHYQGNEFLNTKRYKNVFHGIEIFKDSPLLFEPGEKYSYSSYGYNLLSAVIENITGRPYLEFMRDSIFQPLDMISTCADYPEAIIPGRVRFYEKKGGEFSNSPFVDNSYKWAGGGFLSTSMDILRFARVHLDHAFTSKATWEYFTTSQKTNDGQLTGYGMGWRTTDDMFGRQWIGHSGGSVGGTSMLCIYPE